MNKEKRKQIKKIKQHLIKLQFELDTEYAHVQADECLCILIELLGYKKIVREYKKIDKWYA